MNKRLGLKFLRPFYTQKILSSISKLILPFYVIYFLDIWLNLWQIALIGSFRSIVSLISEIPTWTIADLYWKKISVVLWFILSWITVFCIPFFHSFVWICIIFCINALTETLFSGSDQAWVSDIIEAKQFESVKEARWFIKTYKVKNCEVYKWTRRFR